MPKFLEDKLKREHGEKSATPFKIMNAIGAMHGSKETERGKQMEEKHEARMKEEKAPPMKAPHEKMPMEKAPHMRRMEIEIHRGPNKKVSGFTVHSHMMPKASKSAAFMENETHSQPFGAHEHGQMLDHIEEHTAAQLGHESAGEPEEEPTEEG